MKLIVRLSKPGLSINQLLNANHRLFGPITNWANIAGAEVYYGNSYAKSPEWANFIATGTTQSINALSNSGAVALIFIPIKDRFMCFSFGHTTSKLSVIGFERDFGLKVVLNTVDPKKIKSIDSKTVDTVVTSRRIQLSKEDKIQNFGFEINKDLLRSVAGKPTNQNFASLVAGSDTLYMNCRVTASNFYQKAEQIFNNYISITYRNNYEWVDNIKSVKDQTLIQRLDAELVALFNSTITNTPNVILQFASPDVLEITIIDHFKIRGYRSRTEFSLPNMEDVINDLTTYNVSSITIQNLKDYKIEAVDGGNRTSFSWHMYDWIICEVSINNTTYILSGGEWHEISGPYFTAVEAGFNSIINNSQEYQFIGTTTAASETEYFSTYSVPSNEIILDRQLFSGYGIHNTVEICDIYGVQKFIHVKDGGSSSKLSHLFNQGYVSAQLFVSDTSFQTDLQTKLTVKPTLQATIISPVSSSQYQIVFRILKKGLTFSLPFFTKIVLNETYKKIKSMGYKFKLEWAQKV
jgi:uncharacterized protein (TIGR04141 family)